MRKSQRSSSGSTWFSIVRKKFFRSSSCPQESAAVFHTINNTSSASSSQELTAPREGTDEGAIESVVGNNNVALSSSPSQKNELSEEDIAAIKIQASFRGHLARRALRGLKSLVKLQAVVRGVCVRRQARIGLHCMHALARLQITVRGRQLLS